MAKVNKMMPPRNTTIRGQDHLLAYITPEEAQLLMDNGGAGKPGPMGIPAFYSDDDDAFAGEAMASFESDYGGNDGTTDEDYDQSVQQDIAAQAAMNAGIDMGGYQTDFGFSPGDYGSDIAGAYNAVMGLAPGQAISDLSRQIQQAKNYKQPIGATLMSFLNPLAGINKIQSLATQFMGPRMISALQKPGHMPVYKNGRVTGVKDAYGNVVEGSDFDRDYGGRDDGPPEKVPEDLLTGCPEGYVKDEQLGGFCRLDTGTTAASAPTVTAPTTGGYAQMGQLDIAPTGLPQFQQQYGAGFGSPSQFAAANTDFRRRGAVMPAYPGYTLLS
jgi:hypothetical protein